jgi:Beta-propeller repeat
VHARKEAAAPNSQAPATATQRGRVRASLDALPLAFEANQGQTDPQVKYMARGNGYAAFLTANETVFAMQMRSRANSEIGSKKYLGAAVKTRQNTGKDATAAIRMKLVGANSNPQIVAENQLPGRSNYFIGNDSSKWQSGVQQYARVAYRAVYPGVNLAFHGQQRQLEFDFIVAPGANTESIRFDISGAKRIATDTTGDLVLSSAAGDVVLHRPVSYQMKDGAKESVDSRFVVAKNTIRFEVGNYDHGRELVIDPSVSYATYLGGSAEDDVYGIAVDGSGNAYVTGQTQSTNFPVVSGGSQGSNKGSFDVFVSKLSADGTTLEYSTYVGGTGSDSGNAIALDGSGNAYVAGGTNSTNFPVSSSPFQLNSGGALDAFVFELASNGGSLTFSTYLGGTLDDVATGVAVDTTGVYVAGTTKSGNFPTRTPLQASLQPSGSINGFVSKLNSAGNALAYSTFLGAGGESLNGLAIDKTGNVYVTGATPSATFPTMNAFQNNCASCSSSKTDAFVSVINPTGSGFVYSTFLGGSTGLDQGLSIAVDGSKDAYVTGVTQSSDFPVKSSLQAFKGTENAFITELNPAGSALVYSTYLGGSASNNIATGIAVDGSNNAYVVGQTNSQDFPTAGATQTALKGGNDAFVSEISASGSSLLFSTFLGGTQDENTSATGNLTGIGAIAVAGTNIYVASNTSSSDFPVTAGVKQGTYGTNIDGYVAKFSNTGFSITNGALSPTSGHAGVSANATITVTSTAGFAGQVQLACSVSPAPAKAPTCSLTGSSVTLTANGSATATLNVATTAAAAKLDNPLNRHNGVFFAMILPVFGITLLGIGGGSSDGRRKRLFGLFLLGIVITTLILMPACSSSSTTVGGGSGGTPTGAYTITVTGTSGGAQATGSPALTLTIN